MVDPGPRAIKKLQSSALPMRRLDDVPLKIFQRQQSRARTRHENPSRFHERDREQIEVLVFLAPFPISRRVAGEDKFRRIEHHDVPFFSVLLHLARVGKRVGVHKL